MTSNITDKKGFAMPALLGIVVLVVIAGGIIYVSNRAPEEEGNAVVETLEDGTMVKEDGTMVKPDGTMMKPDGTMVKPDGTMIAADGTMVAPGEAMEKKEGAMMEKGGESMMSYGGAMLAGTKDVPLLDFAKADYDAALKTDKLIVLYFYANWCPNCKAEFPLMQAAFNDLAPGTEVIGFRVNYKDNETDANETALAKEFGIAYQHTKVFVRNGVKVLKAPDTWDKNRYIEEIKKAL